MLRARVLPALPLSAFAPNYSAPDVAGGRKDTIMRLMGKRILVRMDEAKSHTEMGLTIPDSAKKVQDRGVIVQSGEQVSPGLQGSHRVIVDLHAGRPLEYEGEELLLIEEEDVVAILPDPPFKLNKDREIVKNESTQ